MSKFLVIARQLLIFELRNRNNELNPQNSKWPKQLSSSPPFRTVIDYSVVMAQMRWWFSRTCWSLAVLASRLSAIFFQRQRCVVGKKKLFVNLRFFAVWLRDGIYMCRGKSRGTMTTQKPNVVQCKSQLLDKEQTALLKLKQHWQNPPSLSHWQIHHLYATWTP